jgi:ubiquitin carboxyl-terminal hydrolase 10
MIQPSNSLTQSVEKNPEKILSLQEEAIFNNFLKRNKAFALVTQSKNKQIEHNFPLYFGTTEDEILPHRKMAFRKKRLVKEASHNTSKSLHNQRNIKKVSAVPISTSAAILPPTSPVEVVTPISKTSVTSATSTTSSTITSESTTPNIISTVNPTTTSTLASQLQNSNEVHKDKEDKIIKPTTETKKQESQPFLSPSITPPAPSTPKQEISKPTFIPSAPLSYAENIKRAQSNKSSSSSSSSTASPAVRSKSIPRSATQSPSTTPAPTFDTVSAEFQTSTKSKSLGITLLRIMFDSQYINRIYHPENKIASIFPHGLQNSGNICYMNSILQFLFYCDPFSQILNIIRETTIKELDETKIKTPILNALLDLQDSFKISTSSNASNSGKYDTINPDKFYSTISSLPRFSHLVWGRQEDAEELLNILLDGLHEEFVESIKSLSTKEVNDFANAFSNKETSRKVIQNVDFIKDASKENASALDNDSWSEVGSNMKTIGKRTFQVKLSPIVNLFGGQFRSVLKASNKKSSITLDPFMQVQLDISDPSTTDLTSAFEKFSQDEEISLGSTMAKKQNFIDKLPSILLIHLKRFSFVANDEFDSENGEYEVVSSNKKNKKSQNNLKQQQSKIISQPSKAKLFDGHIEKIHKFIKYDHSLTLPKSCISTMVSEEPNYKLLGVVYHHGRSTENGHYTADVLTSSNEWIRIDDTNITKIQASDAVADQNLGSNINKTAYILMFQKL